MEEKGLEIERKLRKLNRINKSIGEGEAERNRLDGELNAIQNRLVREFKLKSIDAATRRVSRLDQEITKLNNEIDTLFSTLNTKYDLDIEEPL